MHELPKWLTCPSGDLLMTDNYLVLDTETTNLMKGNACYKDNSLVLGSWIYKGEEHTIVGGEYCYGDLLDAIATADLLVGHNIKFDLKWLSRCGYDIGSTLCYDTMIGEYVLAGNRKWELGLGPTSKRYGYGGKAPFVDICMKGGVCPSEMPRSMLVGRCEKDILQTESIFLRQRENLKDDGLLGPMLTRCMFSPVLADMELRGMHLDKAAVLKEYAALSSRHVVLGNELDELTGGVNPRSTKQMREYLYDTLKFKPKKIRGKEIRGTDQAAIAGLKATNKTQRSFLKLKKEYGRVNALLTKSVQFMYGVVMEHDSIFYAQFNQCVTKTHRLSSSGVALKFAMYDKPKSMQFQNFPRVYKGMFCSRYDGWDMGEIDGAQLEFRVAAFLGQDSTAMLDIENGADVHQFTADTITEAGQELSRQEAKSRTFKPLYGGSSGTKAEQAYYAAFKEKYNGVAKAQQAWLDEVLRTKSLRLASGLKMYWPDTKMQGSGFITNTTQICNAPVQSLATADIMPIAITYQWYRMRQEELQSFLVNTIHDSSIGEVHPEETELYSRIGVKAFTEDTYFYMKRVYGIDWNVTMGAGVKIGKNWGQGKEILYTVKPGEING